MNMVGKRGTKMTSRMVMGILMVSVLATGSVFAADSTVYVVHAIPGQDLGVDPALPVDIQVVGVGCALQDFRFGSIAGPLELAAGRYDIEIRLANAENPCSGALAVPASVNLSLGENSSIVAHLTEQGTATVSKFVNDVRSLRRSDARVAVRHTAALPPVTVDFRKGEEGSGLRFEAISNLGNAAQATLDVEAGRYSATVFPVRSLSRSLGPLGLDLNPSVLHIAYAVGSSRSGTANVLVQAIPLN
jgi:hypothetical protein